MLRRLAGFVGDDRYETPGERCADDRIADMLALPGLPGRRARDPERRRAEVLAFVIAAGGD